MLAAVGVRPQFFDEDPYVGFSALAPLFVEGPSSDGRIEMVTARNKTHWFCPQRFPKEKDSDTYRIVCMGGSTTYGRPYDDTTSFCGWLRELLPDVAAPGRFEVINAGGISYASYRVGVLMEELVKFDPDLFIIYTGHNEFLERRTYSGIINTPAPLRGLGALASRTRTFAGLRHLTHAVSKDNAVENASMATRTQLANEVNALLDRSMGPSEYTRDDKLRAQVVDHFQFSLARMLDIARSGAAEVILVTPASNLRNCSPFKSESRAGLIPAQLQQWQQLFQLAMQQQKSGQFERAIEYFDRATAIDDRYAHLHYYRGRALEGLGRYVPAKAAYERALEEDVCSLRAIRPIRRAMKNIASERNVPLVDFAELAEKKSANQITGNQLFLDHVHPTIEGHRELALAIIETILRHGFIEARHEWSDSDFKMKTVDRVTETITGRIDQAAHAAALRNVAKVMSWGGKTEEAYLTAVRATEISPQDAEAHYQTGRCAQLMGRPEIAMKHYRRVLQIEPNLNEVPEYYSETYNNLGSLFVRQGNLSEAEAHYKMAIKILPSFAQPYYNLGVVCEKQHKLDVATKHFESALRCEPNYPEAFLNLGVVYQRQGKFTKAAEQYRHAIRIRPQYKKAQQLLRDLNRARSLLGGS